MRITAIVAMLLSLGTGVAANAAPTPEPGGANQAAGVAATFGHVAFNGEVRLTPRQLRDATAADGYTPSPGQKWLIFNATGSNGTKKPLSMQQFSATIVNGNGESVAAQPDKVLPIGGVYGIAPGGGWKEQVFFEIPADFVPVKIVLVPADGKHKAFRVTVRPADYKPAS